MSVGTVCRTEEDEQQPCDLADREQQVDRRSARVEQLVGDETVRDCADDARERADHEQRACQLQRVTARLLQVQYTPGIDCIARDVDRRARQREHPDRRDFQNRQLRAEDAAVLAGRGRVMIVAPIGDCRQPERARPILHQRVRHRGGCDAGQRRHPESPMPAEQGDDRADSDEGQAFTDRVRRAPDAVAAAALAVAEPRRHSHHAAGRAEALEPAVQSPHQCR